MYYMYTEPQKKRRTKIQFSILTTFIYNEIVYMCKDKILMQL